MTGRRRFAKTYVRLRAEAMGAGTDNALLAQIGGGWVYIPRTLVKHTQPIDGGVTEISVEEWWAKQKGFM